MTRSSDPLGDRRNVSIDSDDKEEEACRGLLDKDVREEFLRIGAWMASSRQDVEERRKLLLYFLVREKQEGGPARARDVAKAFYRNINKAGVRQAILRLNDALRKYYKAHHAEQFRICITKYRAVREPRSHIPRQTSSHDRTAIEEFFGPGACRRPGAIIVQSDSIDRIVGMPAAVAVEPRLFKARTWINHYDTEAANAIRRIFERARVAIPELVIADRSGARVPASAPWEVALGLGFTRRTGEIVDKACGSWMQIISPDAAKPESRQSDCGDAVALHESLVPQEKTRPGSLVAVAREDSPEYQYLRLRPHDWDAGYVGRWLKGKLPRQEDTKDVDDYAILLRHTRDTPYGRRVQFVLAGFTERSTGIAGRYLEGCWPRLWERFVAKEASAPSRGDFLILIAGPSNLDAVDNWEECEEFQVTPKILATLKCKCEWTNRK